MNIGYGELVMLAVIILIIFSASRMGSLGNAIGKFVYSFKKASKGDDFIEVKPSSKLHGNNAPIEDAHVIDENKRT
ncbi:MAG: sec-independent translocation protein [Myxococcaceae bacterium]|nr:sec-independent translocation protein [Myxococcaceae bacterium]